MSGMLFITRSTDNCLDGIAYFKRGSKGPPKFTSLIVKNVHTFHLAWVFFMSCKYIIKCNIAFKFKSSEKC
jgi:hypothetical protein